MKEQIENLINRYSDSIDTLRFIIQEGGEKQFHEGQIESLETVIADLKNLNEAIIHEPPSGDAD